MTMLKPDWICLWHFHLLLCVIPLVWPQLPLNFWFFFSLGSSPGEDNLALNEHHYGKFRGFPSDASGKEPACQCRPKRWEFDPWVRKTLGRMHRNLLQNSLLDNAMDRGAWWATVHRVAQSWTRLKWLSTHAHGKVKRKGQLPVALGTVQHFFSITTSLVPWTKAETEDCYRALLWHNNL